MVAQYAILEQLEIEEESSNAPITSLPVVEHDIPSAIRWRLFTSHFLSTWNARSFEFGAVLFLASIFPATLLPMSVYALTRGISAILFSPAVGRYIDLAERLHVVRLSIGKNLESNATIQPSDSDLISAAKICCGHIMYHFLVSRCWLASKYDIRRPQPSSPCTSGVCRKALRHHEYGGRRARLGKFVPQAP